MEKRKRKYSWEIHIKDGGRKRAGMKKKNT